MFLVIICGTRAVWLEALNTSLCFLGFMAPIQMSWNSHTWRSRNWEGPRPFFLHGESKGTLVNIGKHILYKEASKKTPNNTKNEKTQPNKTIPKSFLKCNDQKNFTMVDTLEKSLLGWKLTPATILKVCKGLTCVHKTLTAFLHFLLTYRVKILDKLLKRKGFIIFLTWSEFHSQAKKTKKSFCISPLVLQIIETFYLFGHFLHRNLWRWSQVEGMMLTRETEIEWSDVDGHDSRGFTPIVLLYGLSRILTNNRYSFPQLHII